MTSNTGTAEGAVVAKHGKLPNVGHPHTPKIMDRRHFQHKTDSARDLQEHSQPMPDLGENSFQMQTGVGENDSHM